MLFHKMGLPLYQIFTQDNSLNERNEILYLIKLWVHTYKGSILSCPNFGMPQYIEGYNFQYILEKLYNDMVLVYGTFFQKIGYTIKIAQKSSENSNELSYIEISDENDIDRIKINWYMNANRWQISIWNMKKNEWLKIG